MSFRQKAENLGRKVSEYFFGTETHKAYQRTRNLLTEYYTNNQYVKIINLNLFMRETAELLSFKAAPNIIDAIEIGHSLITGQVPYYLLFGEGARVVGLFFLKTSRKDLKSYNLSGRAEMERTADILVDETGELERRFITGDEWKQGFGDFSGG